MSDGKNDLEVIKHTLRSADAGVWDKHYGKGLSAEYARRVHSEITKALAAVERLDAERRATGAK